VAVEEGVRLDGFEGLALASFFDGVFAGAAGVSFAGGVLATAPLALSWSSIAVLTSAVGFVAASFAGVVVAGAAWLTAASGTREVVLEVDVAWSSTNAPPITPTTIVPKAIEK
jgi:hypothetical protein